MCILIVEDEPLIRLILVEWLNDEGFEVQEAESGDAAAALINTLGGIVKIVVTDVHMPGSLDGIQLASYVRQQFPGVPVIFTTGRPDTLNGLKNSGARECVIKKPYVPSEVVACIKQFLGPAS